MSSTTHKPPKSFSASSATGSSRNSSSLDAESQALKNKYSNQLETLRELFPDWKDEDLLPVLAETDGSLEEAIERISSGQVSQWGEVKKKSKEKAKKHDDPSQDFKSQKSSNFHSKHQHREPRQNTRTSANPKKPVQKKPANGASVPSQPVQSSQPQPAPTTTPSASTKSSSSGPKSWAELLGNNAVPKPTLDKKNDPALKPTAPPANEDTYDDSNENISITVKIPTTSPEPTPAPAPATVPAVNAIPADPPKPQKLSWAAIAAPKTVEQPKKIIPALPATSVEPTPTEEPEPTPAAPTEPEPAVEEPTAEPEIPEEPVPEPIPAPEPVEEQPTTVEQPIETTAPPPGLNKVEPEAVQFEDNQSDSTFKRQPSQEAPVVLPGAIGNRGRLGVQFGSLNLAEDEQPEEQKVEEPIQQEQSYLYNQQQQQQQQQQQHLQQSQQPQQSQQLQQPQQPQQLQQHQQPQQLQQPQQPQQLQQQPPQQPASQQAQQSGYNSYNRYNQRQSSGQYSAAQPPTQPQKYDIYNQTYNFPGNPGYNNNYNIPNDYYGGVDRNSYAGYYNMYQQPGLDQTSAAAAGGAGSTGNAARYGAEKTSGAAGSAGASQSPAIANAGISQGAPQFQQPINPYYYPGYGYYYPMGFSPQQQYAVPNHQKNYYNQQSYYNEYRQVQQPQQGQQQGQQPQLPQQPQQPQQQPQGAGLSGISEFLQRDDIKTAPGSPQGLVGAQISGGQQAQPQQQQPQYSAQQPQQQQQQQQQNMYPYANTGYGNYGQRQGWNYNN